MNLAGIAGPLTRAVTPSVTVTLKLYAGRTTAADGTQTPTYDDVTDVTADFQAVGGKDLRQLDSLNIQGVQRVAYLAGNVEGINRPRQKGGDLVVVPSDMGAPSSAVGTWLVVAVLETWDTGGWCKVALTQQVAP